MTDTTTNATSDTAVDSSEKNSTIAVYESHEQALTALQELEKAGFDDNHVSVVGKGVKEQKTVHGWIQRGSEAGHFGAWGAFWGALSGWLLLGFVWLPGIGWVAAGGWLAATLAGAGLGAGLGALMGLGVPKDEIPRYETELKADHYLVIVHGTAEDVIRAEQVLRSSVALHVHSYVG